MCRCAFCQICLEIDPNDVQFFSTMEWHSERLVTLETSYQTFFLYMVYIFAMPLLSSLTAYCISDLSCVR